MATSIDNALDKDEDTRGSETLLGIVATAEATHVWLYKELGNITFAAPIDEVRKLLAPDAPAHPAAGPVVALDVSDTSVPVGTQLTLIATATSAASTVQLVEYYDNGLKIGETASQPYQLAYAPQVVGRHTFVAKATDALGAATTSNVKIVQVTAAAVLTPTVSLAAMPPGRVGTQINLLAQASEVGGSIAKVEFFYGAQKIGESLSSPYATSYVPTKPGTYLFTAKATDANGVSATSAAQSVVVSAADQPANQPPSVSLSLSSNSITLGQSTTLTSLASDTDGTVTGVTFRDGTAVLASFTQPPYQFVYTPNTTGNRVLSATATDDDNATATATQPLAVAAAPGKTYTGSYTTTDQDYVDKCKSDGASQPVTRTATSTQSQADADAKAKAAAIAAIVCAVPPIAYNTTLDRNTTVADGMSFTPPGAEKLMFDLINGTSGASIDIAITALGATSYITLAGEYAGKGYAFLDANGVRHDGTFPNADNLNIKY